MLGGPARFGFLGVVRVLLLPLPFPWSLGLPDWLAPGRLAVFRLVRGIIVSTARHTLRRSLGLSHRVATSYSNQSSTARAGVM